MTKHLHKFAFLFLVLLTACGGSDLPKDQYDEVYTTESDGYPEYLLVKKLSDSTYQYAFFPEDFEMTCAAQLKGVATNQFYKRGADIVVQKDGSGISTYRYTADNYKCSMVLTMGFPETIKVHSHCNGGNICPEDDEYVLEK